MIVIQLLQHVLTLRVVLNVNVVLVILVLNMSLLMNSESSLMKVVGIPTNVMLPLLKIEEETLKALLLFQLIVFSLMLPVTTSMVLKEDSLALVRTALKVTDSLVKMSMNTPPTATNVMIMQYPVTHMAHTRANVMLIALVPVWIVKLSMNVQPCPHHVNPIPPALIRMIHTRVNAMTVSK